MAPVMYLLQQDREPYHLFDLSQHGSLTGRILNDFDLHPIITRLDPRNRSVETYLQAGRWLAYGFGQALFGRHTIRQRYFLGQDGIVLVHGDTLSTLLGIYLARAAGLKTAMIEAGLSSHNLLDPFPEEWIRRHACKKVDYLFAPNSSAEDWLRARKLNSSITNTGYNTGKDALNLITHLNLRNIMAHEVPLSFGVVTLHRLETLSNSKRLRRTIQHVLNLAEKLGPLRFYMHPPTINALNKNKLLQEVQASKYIEVHELASYPDFVSTLARASYILTDGGSIQEEASFLNKPCLVLRNRTERSEGLDHNVILTTWDVPTDLQKLLNIKNSHLTSEEPSTNLNASKIILEILKNFRARP